MVKLRMSRWWCFGLPALLAAGAIASRPLEDAKKVVTSDEPFSYMRATEDPGRSISLEVAARTFRRQDDGPSISLVSVAHIGEPELYDAVQELLARHDVVLYESVMPPGGGGAGGSDDAERRRSTEAAMGLVAAVAWAHREARQRFPADLDELTAYGARVDPRMTHWLAAALVDGWGAPVTYGTDDQRSRFELVSRGADGRPGGEDAAADIRMTDVGTAPAGPLNDGEDNLQAELAHALGLEFQLDAIDYGRANFRCSDLDIAQLERALAAEGVDFGPIGGSLAGSSLPGRLIIYLLRIVRFADIFLDGAISDAMKVMLIEMLSDEHALEMSLAQFGRGFEKVIIGQRNQVVVDDVKSIVEHERDVDSIAILYGAAHMPDMADRLHDQLGYGPAEEQWMTAFEVDLANSSMSPSQLESIRMMVRQQLDMMRMQNATKRYETLRNATK